MARVDVAQRSHSVFWWYLKVILGLVLVMGVVARFGLEWPMPAWAVPREVAQALVVAGVGLYVYHYWRLRSLNRSMRDPMILLNTQGLYRLIRHPMYLADMVYYAGLALLWPGLLSAGLWLLAVIALERQARVEDHWCAERFGEQHTVWARNTRLLVPLIY